MGLHRRDAEFEEDHPGSPGEGSHPADDPITRSVIGAAIDVHRALGPGLLESAYQVCLAHELAKREVPYIREAPLPVIYDGVRLDCGYRLDFVVARSVVVEVKCVESVTSLHLAQLLTYLRLSGLDRGLLLNFNTPVLKNGIFRRILSNPVPARSSP